MSKGGIATLGLFYKIDRSTPSLDPEALEGKLTAGRSTPSLDPEALEGKLTTGRIHYSMLTVRLVDSAFNVH